MFNYYHFFYDYYIINHSIYKRQIRIIRNDGSAKSVGDACGFAYNGKKIREYNLLSWKHTGGWIYHYGWIYESVALKKRKKDLMNFLKSKTEISSSKIEDWDIGFDMRLCKEFKGSHPRVMKDRVKNLQIDKKNLSKLPLLLRPYYYRRKFKKIFGI